MARLLRSLLVLTLLLLATACYPVLFETQELQAQLDREQDLVAIELTLTDLSLDSMVGEEPVPKRVEEALDFLGRATAGERVFIVPLELEVLDVEEELRKARTSRKVGAHARPAQDAFLADLHVVEARLELGEDGRLDLVQRVELRDLAAHLEALNEEWRALVLADAEKEGRAERLAADPRSQEALALADARAGRDWIEWGDDGLVARIPVASEQLVEDLRSFLRDGPLLEDARDADHAVQSYLMGRMSASYMDYGLQLVHDLRVERDHVVLYLGTPEGELAATWEFGVLVRLAAQLDPDGEQAPEEGLPERDRAGLLEALDASGLGLPRHYTAED